MARVVIDDPDHGRGQTVDDQGQKALALVGHAGTIPIEEDQQQDGHDHRQTRQLAPVGDAHHRLGELELGLAIGVVNAPIGPGGPLGTHFPSLVKGLHDVVGLAPLLGARQEAAQKADLIGRRGLGPAAGPAIARPADLPDDHRLARKLLFDIFQPREDMIDRFPDRHLFPVRQQVDGDEIDVVRQFGMAHPDVGRLGGADRQGGAPADAVEILGEFRDGDIAPQ